ncbi:MAG: sugar phosphate isomerase [Micrococcales bacterium 70-64]|nr:TIM barrel protein [Leifsonia sp.]ODU64458.1 MAG: sugar phosphate isomerase [Leifsonia sp. SCN 70-46]OJX86149.1 MAG: sugar phosphate isomerase [Micrococcales bacterium 70-64]
MTERRIKWSYMDHWRSNGPSGPIDQWHSRLAMSRFLKQVAAVGFDAIDTFDFRIWQIFEEYGSVANYQEFVQEHGLERIVNTFHGVYYDDAVYAPEVRETRPAILEDFKVTMDRWSGIQLDNIIVMPGSRDYSDDGVSDDRIKVAAETWGEVGRITREYGVNLTCHHEFYGGIRTPRQIELFYQYADPEYVKFFLDTAQHCIADVDPVALYDQHHERVSGFHFKDTRFVDTNEDYKLRPDAELLAKTTEKWFYEMGTAEGLVDFEAMMRAVKDHGYTGWISVEHDKANKIGGDYSESTAISRWYAKNVLEEIYR